MSDRRPLGVFDSGVGGLTVLRAMHDLMPLESTVYVGDLAHFPYGPKPAEHVRRHALAIVEYLLAQKVKAIVVACNTATSAALTDVMAAADVPVVGVVTPGAEAAVARSRSKVIGVVATEGTVRSASYKLAIEAVHPKAEVHQIACGGLVDLIEAGGHGADGGTRSDEGSVETLQALVREVVDDLLARDRCDAIILGCTHFPLVRDEFERSAGGGVAIIDSASSTANAVAEVLAREDLTTDAPTVSHRFLTTAHADAFVRQARVLFGEHIEAEVVDLTAEKLSRERLAI